MAAPEFYCLEKCLGLCQAGSEYLCDSGSDCQFIQLYRDLSNQCECDPNSGTYDNGFSPECQSCAHNCQKCECVAENCLVCNGGNRTSAPDCDCIPGYQDSYALNANPNCFQCLVTHCQQCSSETVCSECDSPSRAGPNCNCAD